MRLITKNIFILTCATLLNLGWASATFAQGFYSNEKAGEPSTRELQWLNENYLSQQRERIDEVARRHTGRSFNGGLSDLALLQRLINEEHIDKDETQTLQAMGVILGDVYVGQHDSLNWRVYEDPVGASHVVCVDESTNCIFVTTMISKRVELGLKPEVKRLYDKGLDELRPFMPKRPFQD